MIKILPPTVYISDRTGYIAEPSWNIIKVFLHYLKNRKTYIR